MNILAEAQARALDDARVTFLEAQAALDQANATIGRLNEAHLLPERLSWEGIDAINRMCDMLDDLIQAAS